MKRPVSLVVRLVLVGVFGVAAAGQVQSPQPEASQSARKTNRRALLQQLDGDVVRAIANATRLSEKDKQKLEQGRERVREDLEARRQGYPSNAKELRKALDDIRKVCQKEGMRREDREAVLEDLRRLKQLGVGNEPRSRDRRVGPRVPRPGWPTGPRPGGQRWPRW
jgi:phenylalanyl-tRNA synthetase alpha subunit